MPTIEVDGNPLFYRRYSDPAAQPSALPVVLVHGAGGTLMHWPSAVRRMAGRTVYALDLPGHGDSAGPGARTIDAYAATLLAWLDGVGLPRIGLVGHSMGGAIAQTVALAAPDRIAALGLAATGPRLPVAPALLDDLQHAFPAAVRRIARLAYARKVDAQLIETFAEQLESTSSSLVYGDFLACSTFDVTTELGRIACPTLVLCGTADRMTPLQLSNDLVQAIPNAILHTIEGAGHMVMQEEPEQVAGEIDQFLRGP